MITYKDLFKLIKALPENGYITASDPSETYRKLLLLDRMQIVQAAQLDEGHFAFYPHSKQLDRERAKLAACIVNTQAPKQVKPSLVVLDAPTSPETAPIPKTVQVNWSRGFSGANYLVLGYGVSNGERYYLINNSTDENKPMLKRVWAKDCRAGNETVVNVAMGEAA